MTGVLLLDDGSLLLHAARRQHNMSTSRAPNPLIILIMLSFFLGQPFTGYAILTLNPLAQVDKLAPLRTEGTKRIIFPLDLLTAGWTFHES